MRCRWLPDGPPKPVLKESSSVVRDTTKTSLPGAQISPAERQMKSIELKVMVAFMIVYFELFMQSFLVW